MAFKFIRESFQKLASKFFKQQASRTVRATPSEPVRSAYQSQPKKKSPIKADTPNTKPHNESPAASATARSTGARHSRAYPSKQVEPLIESSSKSDSARFYVTPKGTVSNSASFLCLDCIPQFSDPNGVDLEIELGIDFGTKYTKICFRDTASNQTEVVTFTNSSEDLERTLILSQVGISKTGEVVTGLTKSEWQHKHSSITETVDFLKMRMAYLDLPQKENQWLEPSGVADTPEMIENLSAYFLSSIIVRSQYWLRTQHADIFLNRSVGWILNVGAPVEYWEGPAISRFEKVLKMAWALSCTPAMRSASSLTLEQLNVCISQVRTWIAKHPEHPFDCFAKPEIAAAVWSHIQATGASEGFFTFFDIGDGTTEGAAFRYYEELGESKIDFYAGSVKPLGVSAFVKELEVELQMEEAVIRACLLNSQSAARSAEINASQTRKALQRLVASVVVDGCEKHREIRAYQASDDIGSTLKIFTGGGGGNIPFYRAIIQSTHTDFGHGSMDIPRYELRKIPCPKGLKMGGLHEQSFNRFAIAYGLSIPDGEFPRFNFPSSLESGATTPSGPSPSDYSDSKDLC